MARGIQSPATNAELIPDWDDRLPWKHTSGAVTAAEVLQGSPETGLSVVVGTSSHEPTKGDLVAVWSSRAKKTVDPVLVCVEYPSGGSTTFALFGPDKDAVPVLGADANLTERFLTDALTIDSPVRLSQEVRRRLGSLRSGSPGFRNEGLFASHVLSQQPHRPDWGEFCRQSGPLLGLRTENLLTGLGYTLDVVPEGIVLREGSGGQRRAAAVVLTDGESLDNPISRFQGSTAIAHGLALARRENVPWLILLGGSVARLYPANPDVGVGRKGQTQTFAEVDLALLTDMTAGYLSLLFAPDALVEDGTVATLLADSSKYATGLSERLRDRIYEDVIPTLAVSVAVHRDIWSEPVEDQRAALDEAYHQAMIVLFRLLFVAYAEDRGLLPLDQNEAYTSNALKTLARRILDEPDKGFSSTSTSLWTDLVQIWDVIDQGDLEGMGVPAYNGGLFTRDADKNPSGAATYDLRLKNDEIGPVIQGLMIDVTPDGGLGLVDFRSLDVREFGTIYEGLLESGLGIADTDLTIDENDTYIPATADDEVWVEADSIYFHSRSGSRKATGSYFTKPFAVQHLLNTALEPALDAHLDKVRNLVSKGAHKTAAETLFDFRVADLSMGSAHFLVAAIDRIEARFSEFLALNPLAEVAAELHSLRTAAAQQLGMTADEAAIDDGVLLRRQIARRCIYGIDLNEIAVELARLAIWIHTFVPGLPLSFLNHGLIHGNSLTGVGTLDEIVTSLEEARQREDRSASGDGLFGLDEPLHQLLDRAGTHLAQLAELSDASIADVSRAGEVQEEISRALEPLTALCDLITAERTTRHLKMKDPDKFLLFAGAGNNLATAMTGQELEEAILRHPQLEEAKEVSQVVLAAHFPTRFPEVFRREPAGFDVILGNPPWEKAKIEESRWWSLRFPGLRSMEQHEQDARIEEFRSSRPDLLKDYEYEVAQTEGTRHVVLAGPYPGIGKGDLDLYKAFAWRFVQVVRPSGWIGVVFPRSLLSEKGTAPWRAWMFDHAEWRDVSLILNKGRWAFDIHPQWTIALVSVQVCHNPATYVCLRGPAASLQEFVKLVSAPPISFPAQTYRSWGEGDAFRIMSSAESGEVYQQMMHSAALGETDRPWRFRPFAELHSTADKPYMDLTQTGQGSGLPIYKGESFNIWEPDTGTYYGRGDREVVIEELQRRRSAGVGSSRSPFSEFSADVVEDVSTLPALNCRIAFRKISSRTNSRTVIACLVPPGTVLTDGAPYLLRPKGTERDEAYLLGVLCSIPLDWAARNVVEVNVNYPQINSLPIPDPGEGHPWRDRVGTIAGTLAAVDGRFSHWASLVGVPTGSMRDPKARESLIAELDALVCLLYGLNRRQVEHIFATFHRGWDYQPRLAAVLAHYDAWARKINEGE